MSPRKIALLSACATLCFAPAVLAQAAPAVSAGQWADKSLAPEVRADAMVKAMTLDEKLTIVFGYFATNSPYLDTGTRRFEFQKEARDGSAGFVPGVPRLGIPNQWQTDASLGVATQRGAPVRIRTGLPSTVAIAASWNRETAFAGGAMIGREARLSGFNVQLAGGVNLTREPRGGRTFEYSGEDPLEAGTIDGNAVKGIQSNHIISTVKHFAFNDQETSRNFIDVKVDEASGRQSDLLAFQFAMEIGQPGSVMCSYNRTNGVYGCENEWLLKEVLKSDWNFKGYVMTDWGAGHSTVAAANNGLDQQTGWAFDRSAYFEGALREAINDGYVSEDRATDMARRILYSMFKTGLYDNPVSDQSQAIDLAADGKVSQAAAEDSMVLLKNHNLLPVAKTVKSILFVGSHADFGVISGGGSTQVYAPGAKRFDGEGPEGFPGPLTYFASSPMKALQARTSAKVSYVDGKDPKAAAAAARKADLVIVFANQWQAESQDVPDLSLPDGQDELIEAVAGANSKTVVVLETGGAVTMPWLPKVGAVLEAWYPGTSGGEALARVLTGEVNPSGRLPITFPASVDQLPRLKVDGDVPQVANSHPHVDYTVDGAAVGYKWYDQKGLKPLFAFGHGLSFTTFATSGLSAKAGNNGPSVSVSVKNTGATEGRTVTEIYVSPAFDAGWEAPKRLGAFAKTDLRPGETKTVSLTVDPRLLATFDAASKKWVVKAGDYKIMSGDSVDDITATTSIHLGERSWSDRGN